VQYTEVGRLQLTESKQQIDRPNLNEIVREHIRRKIVEGELAPGTKVPEAEIADELGVSRTPVKLSLVELAKEGVIELVPRKGAFVRKISHQEYLHILDIREALEGVAARDAAERIGAKDLAALRQILDRYEEAAKRYAQSEGTAHSFSAFTKLVKLDVQFHDIITQSAGNDFLDSIMRSHSVLMYSMRTMQHPLDPENLVRITQEHQRIVNALESRDGERSEGLMRAHIDRVKRDSRFTTADPQR
jgi:DNA-binding GntR family transcriptional regulator